MNLVDKLPDNTAESIVRIGDVYHYRYVAEYGRVIRDELKTIIGNYNSYGAKFSKDSWEEYEVLLTSHRYEKIKQGTGRVLYRAGTGGTLKRG